MNQTLKPTASARAPVTGTDTVTVICKIPQGIVIQMYEFRERESVIQGGTQKEKKAYPLEGKSFKINGPAHGQMEGPRCRIASGFALTEDVPADIWEGWYEQSGKHLAACQNGLLLAFSNTGKALGAAKEHKGEKSGLERLNPAALPVVDPRFKIKTAEEQLAEIIHPVEE